MLKKERQAYILHQVNLHNKILCSSICQDINVSEDTIRRDLQELSDEGKLIKVHGGALSLSFNGVIPSPSTVYSLPNKKLIAQKALGLLKEGMFIMTTGGTTILELARILPDHFKATFISGSIPAILEYMNRPMLEVIVIGDKVSRNSNITVGVDAVTKIRQIRADYCILGINGLDVENGLTDNDWDVVQVKRAMMESSKKVVCLTISEKLNTVQPILVSPVKSIDILITELPPSDPILKPYVEAGILVL